MKKRIITLLAVLALLVTCMVVAAQAETTATAALTGDETCPVCKAKLSEITDWVEATSAADFTAEHVIIKNDLTLTTNPGWGAVDQTILIRSSADFSEAATAVTVSMDANNRFNAEDSNGAFTKKLTIYGEKATLQSKMQNANGGMFRTGTVKVGNTSYNGTLKVYGDITIKPMEGATNGTSGGIVFVNKGEAHFTGVTFDGCKGTSGGVIYQTNGGTVSSFTDCVFKNVTATSYGVAYLQGGASAGFTNCDFDNCSATGGAGGAIYQDTFLWDSNKQKQSLALKVTNCTFTDCSAKTNGGVIYTTSGSTTLTNCTITGSSAATGGVLYSGVKTYKNSEGKDAYLYGQFILDGTTISDCSATGNGGVLYIQHHGSLTVKNKSKIENCTAGGEGAFVATADTKKPTITVTDSTIDGCVATGYGGVISMYLGSVSFENCTVTNSAAKTGGLAFVRGGYLEMEGCTVTGGTATTGAPNLYIAGGKVYLNKTTITTPGNGIRGSGAYMDGGILTLHGTTTITGPNGELTGNIAMNTAKTPKVQFSTSWSGTTSLQMFTADGIVSFVPGTNYEKYTENVKWDDKASAWVTYGTVAAEQVNLSKGVLYAESPATENPRLNRWGHLITPYRSQLIKADGSKIWVLDNKDAWDDLAENEGSYLKLWTNRALQNITGDIVVDFNGKVPTSISFNAENPGTLTAIDTSVKAGDKSVDIPTANVTTGLVEFGGKTYLVKAGEATSNVYPVEYKLASVSLRAAAAGLYYTGSIKFHEEVADMIAKCGVAVTVAEDATADSLANYLYTNGTNSEGAYTGVLVKDILYKNSAEDAVKPVTARAYIELANGTLLMSDSASYSLTSLVNAVVEQKYAAMEGTQLEQFTELYNKLADLKVAGLKDLPPAVETPSEEEN